MFSLFIHLINANIFLLQLFFNFNKELEICVKYLKKPIRQNKMNENTYAKKS